MKKQKFHAGEFVTALPNDTYIRTSNGYTAKVTRGDIDGDGCINVQGFDFNERYIAPWRVQAKYFVPYSENMETSNFLRFKKYE